MRAYFFGNMYLSSIQQGIQAQHCTAELFVKYVNATSWNDHAVKLFDWAKNHKTSILLNGGYSSNIAELVRFFDADSNPYPWAKFHEGEDALSPGFGASDLDGLVDKVDTLGALTCVGIVLPEKIYLLSSVLRSDRGPEVEEAIRNTGKWLPISEVVEQNGLPKDPFIVSKWELELCLEMNKYGLAS